MDVTRDIYTHLEGQEGNTKVNTQTVTLHRTGTKNLKTGEITWNAWQSAEMPAYTAPSITGYEVINPNAGAAVTADGSTTKLADVVFNYKAKHETITTGDGTTMNVSRDIYTQVQGQDKKFDHTQTITLHRTGDKNLATGEVKWNAWQSAEMPAVSAPTITGYVVTNPTAGAAVTADGSTTKLADVVFNYIPATETITTGEGTTMNVTRDIYTHLEGQEGNNKVDTQTVTLHRTGTKNVVTGEITWGKWEMKQVPAYTAPVIANYTVENPGQGYAVYADGSTTKLPDVVFNYKADHQTITTGDGTTMNVTRDIYTHLEGQEGNTKVTTQTITLHRTGDKNLATGEIKWNAWQPAEMPAFEAPAEDGYVVSNPNAGRAVYADGSTTKLTDVVFDYLAQEHKQVINYVDANDQSHIVSTNTLEGKTNTSVAFTPQAPANWQILEGQNIPSEIHFGTTDNQPINILVKHGQKVDANGDTKQVTRTVQLIDPVTGETKLVKNQSVTLTRSTTTDLVTGEVTYGQWDTKIFERVDAPVIAGYEVTNRNDADVQVVNSNTKNSVVTFHYTAEMFNQGINYVDKDTNQVVSSTNVAGQTNSTVIFDANSKLPNDYSLAEGQSSSITIKFGNTNPTQPVIIYVVAQTQPITAGTTKEVDRNIYVNLGDGSKNTLWGVQSVTLHRTAERNLATGEITYGDWTDADMPAYTAPEIENYTVINPDAGKSVHVTGADNQLPDVVFNYKANHEKITSGVGTQRTVTRQINVKLGDNDIQQYTTQSITLTRTGDKNLATGVITWGAWNTDTMPAYPAPTFDGYTVTNPDAGAAVKISNDSNVLNAVTFIYTANTKEITTGEGTEKTVTRDIYTKLGDAQPTKVDTQTVTLHRTGTQNLVTGVITWGAWNTDTMSAYTAPTVDGYTVQNPDAAPSVTVTGSTQNMSVTFNYKAKHETITTGDGTTMNVTRDIYTKLGDAQPTKHDTQTITLHRTGDKNLATGEIKWNAWQPAEMPAYTAPVIPNYTVQNPDAGAEATADGSTTKLADVVFNYKADHQTITTGEGTTMNVTRDIYTHTEGQEGNTKVTTQTITLHRTGDKNLATGVITWGAWNTDTMPAYTAPTIGGYTVTNPDAAPTVTVDGSNSKLADVVFNYKANDQSLNVNYVDEETHNTISTVPVNGKTGQTVNFDAEAHKPAGWSIVKGQNIPSSFTFGSTPLSDVTILIHHDENDRYKVSVPAGEKVITHVGATENVPSLSTSGIKLTWTEDGKEVAAPAGVVITWLHTPDTTKITSETGTLRIVFSDGTSTTVEIPVEVQGAVAGPIQTVDQNAPAPEAKSTVNTSTVDHFGITNVDWSQTPSTATPGANIAGVARVHYSDGTYQDVNVTIDVRKVEDGRNNRDDKKLFRSSYVYQKSIDLFGNPVTIRVNKIHYRIRYTDYKYPVGDPHRVTYSQWETYIES